MDADKNPPKLSERIFDCKRQKTVSADFFVSRTNRRFSSLTGPDSKNEVSCDLFFRFQDWQAVSCLRKAGGPESDLAIRESQVVFFSFGVVSHESMDEGPAQRPAPRLAGLNLA